MTDSDLRQRAEALCEWALGRAAAVAPAAPLRQTLENGLRRLAEPMRVALAGKIKAGKSTLMNALLGGAVVPTGATEATFNVNWLIHGPKPALWVHYKDPDHKPHEVPFSELDALTRRQGSGTSDQQAIRYLEARHPCPLLKVFNLIDLPGLDSFYEMDSANAHDFLAGGAPDAVVYFFGLHLTRSDEEVLADLQGPDLARATPLNTIGLLSKVDDYWHRSQVPDPFAAAQRRVARLWEQHPQLRQLLYTIQPVSGLLSLGAQTLGLADVEVLRALAILPPEALAYRLGDWRRFLEWDWPEAPVPAEARRTIWNLLGSYGVWRASELIRQGLSELRPLADALLESSGVLSLRRMLLAHFGNRSLLLKLARISAEVRQACFDAQKAPASRPAAAVAREVAARFEEFEATEQGFDELRVLGRYYAGKLALSREEGQQLQEVTGEFGISDAERLGLPEKTDGATLRETAAERRRYWQLRANDQVGLDPLEREAARILAVSYGQVLERLTGSQGRPTRESPRRSRAWI